ncbi:Tripartite tricarboxylate transporter TctB family protein [Pseudooceanicola marinus]|uniref:Tripartite tricarboxylate transporter TctB family protein n=1 Tax=Pseudooceanicola marinus TaxID=396013 RepID=A0A1X6Z4U4_9RHOB|nr:tripartite tricarboxylate transporter TctB family protein [Pseudooceanicola marinus]PJE32273.1 tripartite tricarboxylate transporter TctB family protein [Pseudooceanicola marinus]SLN40535.1 Tripartite tricarboxylate transporter TctB family protein [Pseudooceanicola marinus]
MHQTYHRIGRLPELIFGLFLFGIGCVSTIYGWSYGLGRLNDIGPGAFPMGLGIGLMILAALAMREAGTQDPVSRRLAPAFFYLPGVIIWALLIEGAGLLVATMALILMCSVAEEHLNLKRAVLLSLILTAVGYLVFILGFGLTFNLIGDWF